MTVWWTSSTVEDRLGRQETKVRRARKGRMVPRAILGPRDPRDPKVNPDRKDRKGSLATATAPSCATRAAR